MAQAQPQPQTLSNDLLMRSIKIVDIGYITVLYMAFSLVCASIVDKAMGKFDVEAEAKKTTWRLTAELFLTVWLYGVLIYFVRNLVSYIPFPLDGIHGYNHSKVKELQTAIVFTFTFVLFCDYMKTKVKFYYDYTINGILNQSTAKKI